MTTRTKTIKATVFIVTVTNNSADMIETMITVTALIKAARIMTMMLPTRMIMIVVIVRKKKVNGQGPPICGVVNNLAILFSQCLLRSKKKTTQLCPGPDTMLAQTYA